MIKTTTVVGHIKLKLQRKISFSFQKWKDFIKVSLFSRTLNNESAVLLHNTEEQQ